VLHGEIEEWHRVRSMKFSYVVGATSFQNLLCAGLETGETPLKTEVWDMEEEIS
jgi:hypothetical protein